MTPSLSRFALKRRVHPQVAMSRQKLDPNDVIQVGERVPYVVVNLLHSPLYKLRESAQRPEHLLFPRNGRLEVNAVYYIIKRILPAIDRIFSLIGIDVFHWYRLEMKRSRRMPLDRDLPGATHGQRGTILGHFESENCVLCVGPNRTISPPIALSHPRRIAPFHPRRVLRREVQEAPLLSLQSRQVPGPHRLVVTVGAEASANICSSKDIDDTVV
ncbi:MAG: hypothetical protein SGPRY_001247 [Prymnesium sp.]